MIQVGTNIKITDNTGARMGRVFKIPGASRKRYASLGDVVILSIKVAETRKQIKKKAIVEGVVVRQAAPFRRTDGSYIRFDDNAVVLIDKKKEPLGGRIFGPIPREIQERGYQKIASLAPEVI